MPREFSRGQKLGDLIQRELARLIQREVKDPRIPMVTINDASVSRDLAYADVYFSVLSDNETVAAEKILNEASGFLRSQLASVLKTRTTPKLRFHYDRTILDGAKLSQAIDEAIASDKKNSRVSE